MTALVISILIIYSIIITFALINLMRKNEAQEDTINQAEKDIEDYEKWFETFRLKVMESYNKLKEVDRKGSFEADDEVGFIFKELSQVMKELNSYVTNKEESTDGRNNTKEEV